MRLGVVYDPAVAPGYRSIDPMRAMERRGHEVVWPTATGSFDGVRLRDCDVVHVYRLAGESNFRALAAFTRAGTPITYDNDDNRAAQVGAEAQRSRKAGLEGQAVHASTVKIARVARIFTTTTESLASLYRRAGVERVEVIENFLAPDVDRPRTKHPGIVVGWIAGEAHQPDADSMKIGDAMRRVLADHPDVRVECVGVDLRLNERYRHDRWVPFEELPGRIGGFDIAIAPLANVPLNQARSNIKVKEYAASGVPWLASPVGPYAELGEKEGGRLVPDDRWAEEIGHLVERRRERRRLGRNGKRWARGQTIDRFAHRWEEVFRAAASSSS